MANYTFDGANAAIIFGNKLIDTVKRDGIMTQHMNSVYLPNAGNLANIGKTVKVPFPVIDLSNVGVDHVSKADMTLAWAESGNMDVTIEQVKDVFVASEEVDGSVERFNSLMGVMPAVVEKMSALHDEYVIGKVLSTTTKDIAGTPVTKFDDNGAPIVLNGNDNFSVLDYIMELSILAEGAGIDRVHLGFRAFTALKRELGEGYVNLGFMGKSAVLKDVNGLTVIHNHRMNDTVLGTEVATFAQGPRTINGAFGLRSGEYIPSLERKMASAYKSVSAYGAKAFGDELILTNYQMGETVIP